MDDNGLKGLAGLLCVLGCAVLYFILRRLSPGFAKSLLIAGAVVLVLLLMLVGVILYLSLRRDKDRERDPEAADREAQLARGRAELLEFKKLTIRVRDPQIRRLCGEIDEVGTRIVQTLREHPEKLSSMRQFFSYYLPTLVTILKKYTLMEQNRSRSATLTASVGECLSSARSALTRMHESIFDSELLDLSVEMDVLISICKRDGLLTDGDLQDSKIIL